MLSSFAMGFAGSELYEYIQCNELQDVVENVSMLMSSTKSGIKRLLSCASKDNVFFFSFFGSHRYLQSDRV